MCPALCVDSCVISRRAALAPLHTQLGREGCAGGHPPMPGVRRQPGRSPKRLVREQVGIIHGPIIGCEYKATGRQLATLGFEPSSTANGWLEAGDLVFPVEARPHRGAWRLRLSLGQGRDVWVSELAEDGSPLLEMVTASAALEEGQPPMRIPDVEEPSLSTTPAARQLPTSPQMRPGLSPSSPPRLRRDFDREDQESVMNEAITQSLALGTSGSHTIANFLPLRDFLRQEVHRLCEAVQDAEKQADEEVEKRQTLEQQLSNSQQTKELLQTEMSIKVQAAEAAAAQEKQRRESLQSQLQQLQQDEGSLRLKLRDEIAQAERKAEAERLEREAVQARLAEVQAAERRSRDELERDVLAAQVRADEERKRREAMEQQVVTAKVEQDKRAVKLRDAVAYAERQLMRERSSREDLEQQLSDQRRQDDQKRSAALAAVARAESAAASEREQRERLQQSLDRDQAENERHAAELRAQVSRAEQDVLAERRDRQAKDRELQTLKSTHAEHLESLRAKLDEALRLAEGEKKLRQSIEMSIADARTLSRSDVAGMEEKLQQAKTDIERERQQRESAEEKLERVTAEEKERAANLSQMLQVLSNEVRAARAEVETLRAGGSTGRRSDAQQVHQHPVAIASLDTWMDHSSVHPDRVGDQGDPTRALSQLQETHEALKKDAETLKQRLVSALQENHAKSEKLKEERAKRKELREEMERTAAEEEVAAAAMGVAPRTPPRYSSTAEETAVAHHDQLADEIATHMVEHASQQAISEERLLERLQISGDALAQALNQCKVANETAKAMRSRLGELTRERDDALQEVIEFKRELETWKARERNSLVKKQDAGAEEGGDQELAETDSSPANSRELQREVRQLRELASTRKQELDQRVSELARLEAGQEKYVANLAEKDDEMESLKEVHAEEVRILHDQLKAKQDKYTQHEREQQERYASSLADAEARAQAAWEERDRASAGRTEERTRAEERLREATARHSAAIALSDTLVAELDQWLNLSQQPRLRAAVVSNGASGSPGRDQVSGHGLSPRLSASFAEASSLSDDGQRRGQSLVPYSPVESAPSEYGGWLSPTPTPAILDARDGDDQDEEDAELNDEALAELYRMVRSSLRYSPTRVGCLRCAHVP